MRKLSSYIKKYGEKKGKKLHSLLQQKSNRGMQIAKLLK